MENVLTDFIDLLVGGITNLGAGIGTGMNQFVQDLFLKVDQTGAVEGLSIFGGVTAVFGGIGLAVGITTAIFLWIRSIGQ